MTKVVKLALISKTVDKDGKEIPYKDICHTLWDLQRHTREIKNKAVQYCWEWQGFASDYKKKIGEYPKERDFLVKRDDAKGVLKDYAIDGYIYDKLKDYPLYSGNNSTTSRSVVQDFKNAQKEILKGEKSILQYKSNQPLDLHKKAIKLEYDKDKNKFYVSLSLLNKNGKKTYGISTSFLFEIMVRDKSTRTILERCYDNIYGISASKLIYNQKKKQWFLNLAYSFDSVKNSLDENKILGVDLGVVCPVVASVNGDYDRLSIKGGEIEQFRKKIEARKYSICRQRPNCANGSIGHGYETRMKPALKISDKVARFRDTFNDKVSRSVIDYAINKNCGVIQMEMLKGITSDAEPFLKNWSYFDLQQKIEYKANEKGIKVVYINPKYTSQRCSKCGYIHRESRLNQATFKCVECGFEANADYNASQNIGIQNIDKIIEENLKTK